MDFAGIKVPDTALVHDAMDLSRSLLEPFLFNHVMRSWLFGIVLAESAAIAPDAEHSCRAFARAALVSWLRPTGPRPVHNIPLVRFR
jgi:hypothetical protein